MPELRITDCLCPRDSFLPTRAAAVAWLVERLAPLEDAVLSSARRITG